MLLWVAWLAVGQFVLLCSSVQTPLSWWLCGQRSWKGCCSSCSPQEVTWVLLCLCSSGWCHQTPFLSSRNDPASGLCFGVGRCWVSFALLVGIQRKLSKNAPPHSGIYYVIFLRQCLIEYLWLAYKSVGRQGWPHIPRDLPASGSQVLGLQAWATIPGQSCCFCLVSFPPPFRFLFFF